MEELGLAGVNMANIAGTCLGGLLAFLLCAHIGKWIGGASGNARAGYWLGGLLGPIGWVIAIVLPRTERCPACGGAVNPGARKCCHCGEDLITESSRRLNGADANYIRVQKVRTKNTMSTIRCPFCGAEYEVNQSEYGQHVTCQVCQKNFVIG